MNKLIPLTNINIYESLFKGKYSKEYIIDFLNSYFHYYGENSITDITFLDASIFTDDKNIKNRIHIYYKRRSKEYYYELKFSSDNKESICFDMNFLPFLSYYGAYQGPNTKIGQIIIQLTESTNNPIGHYYLKSDNLIPLANSFDIHIIYIKALNNILGNKDKIELNSFERWIKILNSNNLNEANSYANDDEVLCRFISQWNFNSKLIRDKNISNKEEVADFALKLLNDGYPMSFVMKITKLDMSYLIDLKRKRELNEVN